MRRTPRRAGHFGVLLLLATAACAENPVTGPDLSMAAKDCVANPQLCAGDPCNSDAECAGRDSTLPRCNFDGVCVACLPDKDTCAAGQVCHQINNVWSCGTRCADNADCVKLSGAGTICCNEFCVNPAREVGNCGGCGNVCPPVINGAAACSDGNCVIGDCNPGYADCDKAAINGCESSLTNDALNCGGCAMECKPYANGLPTCIASRCAAICAPGFADCDSNTMNGCEVDTTYDTKSCGGCGKVCVAGSNAEPACDQGVCRASAHCKLGFADCDGNPANGCETNAGNDPLHCGHCGNICPLRPNSSGASCTAGKCTNACNAGFGDCDNRPENGCEADLEVSLAACGACGKPCSANNANASCAKGVCSLQCKAGFLDCNMDGIDGCESNPLTDPKNCGGCGMLCPQNTPYCNKAVCSPNFPGERLGAVNGQEYYKVQAMGAMTDNTVFDTCMKAGLRTPCQAMVCPSYNDARCVPTQENSCGNPMLLLSQAICNGQSPGQCPALNNCFQYMGNLWNGGSSCGALNGAWCTAGNGVMNGFAVCTP